MWYNNILETVGNTPMVKLNKIAKDIPATVLAKIETTNPGNSIKDRMALKMIEDAEKSGKLKPGGTIIEGTSGNTGMGLAIAAVIKGYKCIFTSTDKQSKEKFDALRAFGAEVIVCPTNVEPEDPRSYYSVSSRLEREVPNSWKPNQYDNPSNSQAHYESTGPEIWEQTEGKITHLIAGVGTGGTISGTARYLKEKNPAIKVLGIDTYGSVFKKYKETGEFDKNEIYPYITEGIGEDFLPQNVDFSLIDHFEKVSDKDAALMTREIARKEGIFAGNSTGSAVAGLLQMKDMFKEGDVVVIIFPDHGTRYLGKMYNDDWLRDRGFIKEEKLTARHIISKKENQEIVTIDCEKTVLEAINTIKSLNISQIPVTQKGMVIGKITESDILDSLIENPGIKSQPVKNISTAPFPFIDLNTSIDKISGMINKDNIAVLVEDDNGKIEIITQYDIINAISA
ncbi:MULTISPECIES: pyridoxal-phosphate dependent enzyme [unclassified Mucilaginibacter]|uniref:pyridoxal-phosphate dependent enzyme n=1 Tax=unclassified Mucilaginibacter TaxID=2617802 RepID=UPI002AC9AA9E|nr:MULTISPECIES: pyridoxal-phosphate dependent enzyme [unclassified Mucilaginibacter]MEB0261539.1 pyridoxal-phosphate dependent enzyme [Mucilaginibacter sp. 10I4]MEB0277824.1 pyridoxal-phosphate dependent enzyme [Mucilaginibacter sp. 10B2]MEB0300629.1 pyridoxal-phosphate dependent enzyme [Mucilaginibacter sp. 5C4]WPX22717.1 pyridoxal-phosphate dependent enzyme [Mucilaginibacter sp. 5C4]